MISSDGAQIRIAFSCDDDERLKTSGGMRRKSSLWELKKSIEMSCLQ
jgi:hypothetical protein